MAMFLYKHCYFLSVIFSAFNYKCLFNIFFNCSGGYMKYFYFMLVLSLWMPFALLAQEESEFTRQITVEESSQYLPDYLDGIYIGMPLADFENIKDTLTLDISNNASDMWFGATEEVDQDGIDEVVYKFDKEEEGVNTERPLYQINIKFLEGDYEEEYISEKFRNYNWDSYTKDFDNTDNEEWILKTNKDYLLIIKKTADTVQIIATMAGTEWDPGR